MLGNREAEEVKVILQEDFTVYSLRYTVYGIEGGVSTSPPMGDVGSVLS